LPELPGKVRIFVLKRVSCKL